MVSVNEEKTMFENEKRKGRINAANDRPLTTDEENIVRKNVKPDHFDVEKFIDYLNSHETIGLDIFNETLLPSSGVGWTYLNYLKPVKRDIFIKRIPIYFYDLDCESEDISLTLLFGEYKTFYTGKPMLEKDEEVVASEEALKAKYDSFDFEPLYKMLDEIVYDIKVPIHLVLDYLKKQCGEGDELYWVFDTWYQYAKINPDLNEDNVFPKNILYAYNTELEKQGKEPVIYCPVFFKGISFLTHKEGDAFSIGGCFPTDENGVPISKWIGVWEEDLPLPTEEELKAQREHNLLTANNASSNRPVLKAALKIKVDANSIVYAAKKVDAGKDVFGDRQSTIVWEPVYIGAKKMKFDNRIIVERREKMGFSLKTLSEMTNINIRTLQRIESGETTPDGLNLIKLMDCLDIDSYEQFIKRATIEDPGFVKFKSGQKPSSFLSETIES